MASTKLTVVVEDGEALEMEQELHVRSTATDSAQPNGASRLPAISADGRWIIYQHLGWFRIGRRRQ